LTKKNLAALLETEVVQPAHQRQLPKFAKMLSCFVEQVISIYLFRKDFISAVSNRKSKVSSIPKRTENLLKMSNDKMPKFEFSTSDVMSTRAMFNFQYIVVE
jgi:hypothetical protein